MGGRDFGVCDVLDMVVGWVEGLEVWNLSEWPPLK